MRNRREPVRHPAGAIEREWLRGVLWLLGALVWVGLFRNSLRDHELLMLRRELLAKLPLELKPLEIDWPFWLGRAVYFALLSLGLAVLGTARAADAVIATTVRTADVRHGRECSGARGHICVHECRLRHSLAPSSTV